MSAPTAADRLVRRPDLVVEDFQDSLLIWDARSGQLHHLDAAARRIWAGCDGQRSLGELAHDLGSEFGVPHGQITGDVLTAGRMLQELGLCERGG